ncbi:MAG: cytochrome P450 [Spirochaetaceae bacterium]|nr:cytochrome P450 [Myxococcales bacterium]MCB9725482.1 cytochrome P450 [Spirochaetaceae bacterium]HPG25560.1 cytochrome P450 [Myxococcota bacterium]
MSSAPGIPTTEIDPIGTPPSELVRALREMARRGPLHRMASGEYLVVTQAGVRDVLKNVDSFSGTVGDVGALAEEDTMLSGIPEPRHGMVRKIVNSALAYHHASLVEPYVRDLAKTLIAEALDACATSVDGSVEIMAAYARRIPSAVIARILGIPADDYELFARWSDEVLARQENDGGSNRPLLDLHPEFTRFITEQVEQRRTATNPPSDVITRLLTNEVDGERLSTRAVCTQAMFLVVAGNETTRNLIGNVLRRLALEPEILSRIHADPALIPRVVEESLRIEPPVQLTARTCTRDIRIDGVEVRKGDRLVLSLNAANRDETLYSDPDEFRLDRLRPRDHVGFGAGPHVCPGAYLARMETQVALEAFSNAVAEIRPAPGYVDDPNPVYWAHGPRTLRVRLIARSDAMERTSGLLADADPRTTIED